MHFESLLQRANLPGYTVISTALRVAAKVIIQHMNSEGLIHGA